MPEALKPPAASARLPLHRSLRAKGWMATLALLGYLLGSTLYISGERGKIFDVVQQLDTLASHEKALALVEASIMGAKVDVAEAGSATADGPVSPRELQLYMETCNRQFAALEVFDPAYARVQRTIARSYDELVAEPARSNWIALREALTRAADELDIRHRSLRQQHEALNQAYQRSYDAVTVESLALGLAGIVAFGSMAAWFFARLAGDVRRLEAHARLIVRGARGVSIDLKRDDELGRLMVAVNRMAVDLDEREKQLELEGQRRSHQDKMLTLGALASGIAHEVNNPLMAISGLAQELRDADQPLPAAQLADSAQQILAQTHRASQAARHLAEVAAPQPAERDWVDVNALVQRAAQLMGYDRRYRPMAITIRTDGALPAVRTSGSALQQVLMQLLWLVCDALAQARTAAGAGLAAPAIEISTATTPGQVELALQFPPVLDFARPEVQRGLLLCRAVVEPLGARLAFGQVKGGHLRITLGFPIDNAESSS